MMGAVLRGRWPNTRLSRDVTCSFTGTTGDAYAAALREKNASRNSAGADARASLRDPAADAAQEAMVTQPPPSRLS